MYLENFVVLILLPFVDAAVGLRLRRSGGKGLWWGLLGVGGSLVVEEIQKGEVHDRLLGPQSCPGVVGLLWLVIAVLPALVDLVLGLSAS